MNTYSSPVRVGIAGATGFAGQELVTLLARHPGRPPGRGHVVEPGFGRPAAAPPGHGCGTARSSRSTRERLAEGNGPHVPRRAGKRGRRTGAAARGGGRPRDRSVRRVPDQGTSARDRVVSGHEGSCRTASAYGLTEFFKDDVRDARLVANPGLLPDRGAAVVAAVVAGGLARRRTPASSSTRSPASPARAARRAIARTSRRITAPSRRMAC